MRPVYERDSEPVYRAECDLCDWWETAMTFGEIRRTARLHHVEENTRSDHDNAVVSIAKIIGHTVNEYQAGDR